MDMLSVLDRSVASVAPWNPVILPIYNGVYIQKTDNGYYVQKNLSGGYIPKITNAVVKP
jgi:hypothetical protein